MQQIVTTVLSAAQAEGEMARAQMSDPAEELEMICRAAQSLVEALVRGPINGVRYALLRWMDEAEECCSEAEARVRVWLGRRCLRSIG